MKKIYVFRNRLNPVLKKILLVMKLTTVIMLISMLHVSATVYSQATKLTLNMKEATIKEVLQEIESMSKFCFIYQDEKVDLNKKINAGFENEVIEKILNKLFEGEDINYSITATHLILIKPGQQLENERYQRWVEDEMVQQKTITGKVSDQSGQPLPGVTVVVKGTTQGTITNADGNYLLSNIPDNATLQFSFVGMRTQEVVVVDDQTTINVEMVVDAIGIEEVVAIGYGTMKKSDITGSISSVPMEFVKNQPVRSLADILQGRAAGVYLNKTSGQIGSNTKIRIRGPNSISGSNEPLTVVDGVIGADMGSVHDIESIEILKDASATAIYGERASNGVILVTTKKATSKVPKLKVSFNTAFSTLDTDYPDMMNTAEYAEFINNFIGAGTFSEAEIEDFRQNGGTDWPASLVQTGIKNDHYISYSQKADKLGVYLSGRYSDEKGTMINTGTDGNYYLRSNVTFDPNERLSFNFDLKANKTKSENGTLSMSDKKYHPVFQALIWSPTEPIYLNEEEGQYNLTDRFGALLDNPYMLAKEQQGLYMNHAISAQFNGRYNVSKSLIYSVTGFASKNATQDAEYQNAWVRVRGEKSSRGSRDIFNWRIINKLQYNKVINNVHNFDLSGIYEAEASEIWAVNGAGENMPLPDLASYYQIGMSNVQTASSDYKQLSRLAYLGRLNYHYKSRYYLTASYRVDGKSGPTNRRDDIKFGAFPSLALSWRASEEPFLVNNGFFDNLKLRFGWGITGNPAESQYATMIERSFDFGIEGDILGYSPGIPVNPNVRWEQTAQTDIGLDMSIFNGRLSFSIDFFKKETTDLLTQIELPSYLGHQWKNDPGSYLQNLGEIHNKGVEVTLDITPVQTRSFYWDVNYNFSLVRNKVIDLGEQAAFLTGTTGAGLINHNSYRVQEGSPLGTMWGYKWLGIWSSAEESEAGKYGQVPGDNKYEDLNNDGKISLEDDGQIIGDANPDFLWGLNNAIHYKNFDLSILIQGMHGQDIFNIGRAAAASIHTDSRTITLKDPATNYWTPENQDTEWPNIYSSSNKTYMNSSRWIEDGSWVKVKYVGLTYNIPKKIAKIGNIALSVSAEELLTFTKYKGFDPEVSASEGSDLWGGFDMGTYPIPSTYTFGISLEF